MNLTDAVEQRTTILNLYNSGIDPEVISMELDVSQDLVMEIIGNEARDALEKSTTASSDFLLNKLYLDAVIDINSVIKESQVRTWNALKARPDFGISFRETQTVLEKHVESKMRLVILHIDLVGSTKMSLSLPIDRLTTIIRTFAQEMSFVVSLYGGYVLKYIGDAVLAFFVVDDNDDAITADDKRIPKETTGEFTDDTNSSHSLQYANVIGCACTMIRVIQEGINPILNQYDYPDLKVRIGIDLGEVAVVQYGIDIDEYEQIVLKRPHLDLVGYTISIAVKMTSLAKPDKIVVGQKMFNKLADSKHKQLFKQLPSNPDIWSYSSESTGGLYNLYGTYDA
jgi:adenylate cyclase